MNSGLSMRFETLAVHHPDGDPPRDFLYIRFDNPMQRRLESALTI